MSFASEGWRHQPLETMELVIPEREARALSSDGVGVGDEGGGPLAAACLQREKKETKNVPVTGNEKLEETDSE